MKIRNANAYWTRLLVALILTTILFFLISYDALPVADVFLFLFFLIGIIVSIIFLIIAIRQNITVKQFPSKWRVIIFVVLTLSMPLNYYYRNGGFWGKKVVEAACLDERSRMDLTLFDNKHFIINENWLIGEETFTGKYSIHGDTIEFDKYPVEYAGIISKKMLWKGNMIFFAKDKSGNYDTSCSFSSYFEVDYDKHHKTPGF